MTEPRQPPTQRPKERPTERLDDDFDLDSLDFRPLTSGLGFEEQDREREREVTAASKTRPSQTQEAPDTHGPSFSREQSLDYADLSTFYANETAPSPSLPLSGDEDSQRRPLDEGPSPRPQEESGPQSQEARNAGQSMVLMAWLMDVFFIALLLGTLAAALVFTTGLPWAFASERLLSPTLGGYAIWLVVSFYLLYFLLLDAWGAGSFGKQIFGLKLVSRKAKGLSVQQVIFRNALVWASFLALGIPSIFRFHDFLSETAIESHSS